MSADDSLIKGCRQYDKTAQHEVYKRYSALLRGVCLRYVDDVAEVKDILQESFLKIFSKIKQYTGKGSFEGWMKRIVVNTAIDYYHKNKKRWHHLEISTINELQQPDETNEPDSYQGDGLPADPFSIIEQANFSHEELLDALNVLPQNYRMVFNLFFIEEYKHKEIAEMLKIDETTSRSRLWRARNLVQKHLIELSKLKLKNLPVSERPGSVSKI